MNAFFNRESDEEDVEFPLRFSADMNIFPRRIFKECRKYVLSAHKNPSDPRPHFFTKVLRDYALGGVTGATPQSVLGNFARYFMKDVSDIRFVLGEVFVQSFVYAAEISSHPLYQGALVDSRLIPSPSPRHISLDYYTATVSKALNQGVCQSFPTGVVNGCKDSDVDNRLNKWVITLMSREFDQAELLKHYQRHFAILHALYSRVRNMISWCSGFTDSLVEVETTDVHSEFPLD